MCVSVRLELRVDEVGGDKYSVKITEAYSFYFCVSIADSIPRSWLN